MMKSCTHAFRRMRIRIAAAAAVAALAAATITYIPDVDANSVVKGAYDGGYPVYPASDASMSDTDAMERGEYLVKTGDCIACHTSQSEQGAAFAGGLKIDTPFGSLYSPNITPDKETGIGGWSEDDFVTAMRDGVSPDGSYYFPVFPYPYFNKMSRDDILAMRAYLMSIPPIKQKNTPEEMTWPFSIRFLQLGWRILFFMFSEGEFEPSTDKSKEWNRGAYLVDGPGHCTLCHTELNFLGSPKSDHYLAGSFIQGYYAPDITSRGLEGLTTANVAAVFSTDRELTGAELAGPMADVEHNSLRYLTVEDQFAIATYLKTVVSEPPERESIDDEDLAPDAGEKLFKSDCASCHDNPKDEAPQISDRKAWKILENQGLDALYEVAIKGDGDMPPRGNCKTCSDARIKAAVDYIDKTATDTPATD